MPKNKRTHVGKSKSTQGKKSENAKDTKDLKSECSSTSRLTSKSRSKISSRSHTIKSSSGGFSTLKSKLKKSPPLRSTPKKKKKEERAKESKTQSKMSKKERSKLAKKTEIGCNNGRYMVIELLGSGGFGDVYKVSKVGTSEIYAMKTEVNELNGRKVDRLKIEVSTMNAIENFEDVSRKNHFVTLFDRGKTDQFKLIVMQLLGPSVADLRRYYICNEFSSTAIRVSQQALQGIWDLHVVGYLHKDIKPQNFAIGTDDKAGVVYVIDLGMAYKYIDSRTMKIKPPREKVRFMGTVRYASRNCHRQKDQSRRDDLESWIYMSVELFYSNILPWKRLVDREAVLTAKDSFFSSPSQDIYAKAPRGYTTISQYVDNLLYEEEPNYTLLQKALEEIIRNENIDVSVPLDWFGYDLTKRRRRKRGQDISNDKDDEAQKLYRNPPPSPDLVCVDPEIEQHLLPEDLSKAHTALAKNSENTLQQSEPQSSYCQVVGQTKTHTTVSEYYAIT